MTRTASRTATRPKPRKPAGATPEGPRPATGGRAVTLARRRARALISVAFLVAIGAVLVFGVLPTRTYLAQRASLNDAEAELSELRAANRRLDQRADELRSPEEIERIARKQYGLVRPGEEAYAVLPPPPPPVELPEGWPFTGVADQLNR